MSTSELDEVVTLLERVLPDPRRYGERLIQQAVLRWAEPSQQRPTVVPGQADAPDGPAGLVDLLLRGAGTYEEPLQSTTDDSPAEARAEAAREAADVQVLLASALGACDCWGLCESCPACQGAGFPGWEAPDVALFQEYVGPAAARLSASWDGEPHSEARPSRHDDDPLRQGVNT
jgi:hypothetical protein